MTDGHLHVADAVRRILRLLTDPAARMAKAGDTATATTPGPTTVIVYRTCSRCAQTWYFLEGRGYGRSPCCGKPLIPSPRKPHD